MYFKILNEDMCHREFQYKEGLNIDTKPFNDTPYCGGGLFYSDAEHILEFAHYGTKIAIVDIPDGEQIIPVRTKFKSHSITLRDIRELWTIETFEWLMRCGANIHTGDDLALRWAAANDYLSVVKFLVSHGADIHTHDDEALRLAAEHGHLNVVKFLVSCGANIHARNDKALRSASRNGHLEVVEYLESLG